MKEAMVARAKKRKWVNFVAGLLVGSAAQPLALFAGPDTGLGSLHLQAESDPPALVQVMGRQTRAHVALNGAIDAQRQGDLDTAAALFQEAAARQNDLTPAERDELARLLAANTQARTARRDAHEQLELAELALAKGRTAEAVALVKKINANELYLSAADKQRFAQLSQRLHVQPSAPAGNSASQAHAKVQQARTALAQANLDAAEALAREAQQMRASFGQREDSPSHVLEDVDMARKDAKTMLQASRAALGRGELDRAEQFARSADRLASAWTFTWGDSPSKALKDIQTARAANPGQAADANRSNSSYAASMGTAAPMQTANTDKARALIRQGRQALAAGDLAQARQAAEQAATLKADLHWSDDNPARLLDDVARAETGARGTPSAPTSAPAIRNKEEATALLQKGREQLQHGDIDEAVKTTARLRAARHIHWGLFEDTPDKLQGEVERARAQRDKKQSVELLAEARKRFEKKDYDTAEKMAYEARKKHGAYSIWDLGDQPDKLLADIQAERQKQRRPKLPDPPTSIAKGAPDLSRGPLAQLDKAPVNPPTMNGSTQQPILAKDPQVAKTLMAARQLMSEAKEALNRGDPMTAHVLADRVRAMRVGLDIPGEDTPDSIDREIDRMSAGRPPVVQNTPQTQPTPQPIGFPAGTQTAGKTLPPGSSFQPQNRVPGSGADPLADARRLMQQNRLIEARDKINEARKLGTVWRSPEDNPNQLPNCVVVLPRA